MTGRLSGRERRIGKRLDARGERGLFDALCELRGIVVGDRYRIESLYAVGGEGAVYLARDTGDAAARPRIAKIPLAPWHQPLRLDSATIRAGRRVILDEARLLHRLASPFLPQCFGLLPFRNPLLEPARGAAFAEEEPCLILEKLGGQDLDAWLCRVHRGGIAKDALRPHLDRLTVGLLQALVDFENRGWLYADLRPGNLRVVGRPKRRVRVLDAGGVVPIAGDGTRFPHVPSYLPPRLFTAAAEGRPIRCTPDVTAVMAGRTLFEVATGQAPKAGQHIDMMRLLRAPVSPPVAEAIAALAGGDLSHCADALASLAGRAKRRVAT